MKLTTRTENLVDMLGNTARRHYGVKSSLSSDTTALHTPKGGGRGAKDGHGGGGDNLGRRHRRDSASIVSRQREIILV